MTVTLEQVTQRVRERLGPEATPEMVHSVVQRVCALLPQLDSPSADDTSAPLPIISSETRTAGNVSEPDRINITIQGPSPQSILTAVTTLLADYNCGIVTSAHNVDRQNFTLTLVVDHLPEQLSIEELQHTLEAAVKEPNIRVTATHEHPKPTISP
ncbi:MAG: hypothetical protein JSW54_10705 [Fidelibacterota bacterium]|nr:MAG: hypothetical protein JSW54_10705 [Candidatus Neomarinimicrobiota bacterium]